MFKLGWGHRTGFKSSLLRWRVGWWIGNNTTLWLHLARWNLPASQFSKMESSVAIGCIVIDDWIKKFLPNRETNQKLKIIIFMQKYNCWFTFFLFSLAQASSPKSKDYFIQFLELEFCLGLAWKCDICPCVMIKINEQINRDHTLKEKINVMFFCILYSFPG